MENNELQKIWKNIDSEIHQKSKNELNLLLASKTKQTINKFLFIVCLSILISLGLIIYLTITSLNRQADLIYLINNFALGLITAIALFSGLLSWYKLQNNKFNQPLKKWLEVKINLLSKCLTGRFNKLYILLIPVMYILTVFSIHVYFEYKPFIEVLKTEESVIGLIVGAPIGLLVAFYTIKKIRKYQLRNLEFLKSLHNRLCNVR